MSEFKTELVSETPHHFVVERRERWSNGPGEPVVDMHSAYAYDGSYVGEWDEVKPLWEKWGIKPERRTPTSKVASVGYSEETGKWFGWSHRALGGNFDTREEAAAFAESVS